MALKSKSSSPSVKISALIHYILLVLMSTKSSNGNVTSITRQPGHDDLFEVASKQEILCPLNTCFKYNAKLVSGISSDCVCQCPSPRDTFNSETYSCEKSKDIIKNHGCTIKLKDKSLGNLPVIDIMNTPGSLRLENNMHADCTQVKASWFYLKNGTWQAGKNGIISVTLKQHWTQPDKWLLKWYSGLHSNYSGVIIKVMVTCEHDSILHDHDTGCLMFKSQGTFKVKQENITPTIPQTSTTTATPSQTTAKTDQSTEYKPSQATSSATEKQVTPTSTSSILPTTQDTTPAKEPRKETSSGDKKMWIAFATGGVTILLVIVGSLIFFFLLCRQRKKQRKEIEEQASTRSGNANDPLHDYEYVVYPVLTEGYESSSSRLSLDNAMYGRGPDNELIIRTPGISMESLATNSINHNRDAHHGNKRSSSAYYPRDLPPMNNIAKTSNTMGNSSHVYAQLQRKEKDSDVESSGIYQPLIRPVTPDVNDNRPNENQDISMEPITSDTSAVPDYMVLEPDSVNEPDASA